jgi:predicted ribosome quality control (RQC) complex YloA/Tae2 family protein
MYQMKIVVDLRLGVPDNAKNYYEHAKKQKGRIPGMRKAIDETKKRLASVGAEVPEKPQIRKRVQRKWYEKYRWFFSSDGFLVLGGKDATTNEMLVKKHLEQNDVVFHADIQGAPFFIVKNPHNQPVPDSTRLQAAQAAASYSKIWSRGMGSADVYEIRPEQVSKTPPAGEYLPKGAFMIYGAKIWHKNVEVKVAVGIIDGAIIGGPVAAVSSATREFVIVQVGDVPQGALARQIKSKIPQAELDEIQRFLPPGGGRMLRD